MFSPFCASFSCNSKHCRGCPALHGANPNNKKNTPDYRNNKIRPSVFQFPKIAPTPHRTKPQNTRTNSSTRQTGHKHVTKSHAAAHESWLVRCSPCTLAFSQSNLHDINHGRWPILLHNYHSSIKVQQQEPAPSSTHFHFVASTRQIPSTCFNPESFLFSRHT